MGKFNIRWDNRIAFFNGLAMAGLRRYYDLFPDEKVAQAILKMIDRTLGFYPEYAGRTLDGLAWAYDRTGDCRYLTLLARTWETTLEYCQTRGWGPGTTLFATRYLPFLERHGLAPKPARPLSLSPTQLASENGLYRTRIPPNAAMLIRDDTGESFDIIILRHGSQGGASVFTNAQWPQRTNHPERRASWEYWNANGERRGWSDMGLGQMTFEASAQPVRRGISPVKKGRPGRYISLYIPSSGTKAWDIITTRPLPRVVNVDDLETVGSLTPRVYFKVTDSKLLARFQAVGEGFHGAVLYDPTGRPAAAVTKFIDLDDKNTYPYTLTAAIPPLERGKVWSMDIQEGTLKSLSGAEPYFATSRAAFFDVRADAAPPRPSGRPAKRDGRAGRGPE